MKLITGRKHQLRCHLSGYLDNPIINDQRYGGKIIKL
jgi:23S rRNA-/tRNA-specific pseudouridylate synthase